MFCGKCGRQNDDNAKFCIGCGQPLNAAVQPKNAAPKKQLPVKTLIIAAAAAVAVIIAIVVIAIVAINAGKTINLDKYLTIEASGYDGYGNAKVTIDWDAIEAKYGKKLSFTARKTEHRPELRMI